MAQRTQIKNIIELGVAQVNANFIDQMSAIAALAQENARARVTTAAVTDLTDSSGGTADGANALAAVVTPTSAIVDNVVLMAPKTAFDTQIGLIEDAHRELLVKANEFIAAIAAGSATVADLTSGAAADNIIAAIAASFTGTAVDAEGVDAATALTEINTARNNQAAIASAVNWVRVAQGLAPIADGSGGAFDRTNASYPTTDAAATAAAVSAGASSLTVTTVNAAHTALRNNIASLAAALTEANAPAIGPFVVATNNPRTRFVAGDVTP